MRPCGWIDEGKVERGISGWKTKNYAYSNYLDRDAFPLRHPSTNTITPVEVYSTPYRNMMLRSTPPCGLCAQFGSCPVTIDGEEKKRREEAGL